MRSYAWILAFAVTLPPAAVRAELAATVQKTEVNVYAQPSFEAPRLKTLRRGEALTITGQLGLWYQLPLPAEGQGYVRVNDVRLAATGAADGDANLRVLMGEKSGQGRVTETAGVRGIDESELRSASLDRAQLDALTSQRVDAATAAAFAGEKGWRSAQLAYAAEPRPAPTAAGKAPPKTTRSDALKAMGGLFGALGSDLGSKLASAAPVVPKGEDELAAEELALGPEIAGRVLGARPLWSDPAAQRRVNLVGRWVASQTSRADLPWTFGVIDTPEINAFAAPGGYVLVTRGLYVLLATDAELAAVLAHEIGHCVQRDHYEVIHKQQLAATGKDLAVSEATTSSGNPATDFARRYAEEHGAAIMLTSLDRGAEYRADESAQYYLARSGINPLALHSVLQKLAALGPASAGLAQLYRTHPEFDDRIDRLDQRSDSPLGPYLAVD